MEQTFENP